MSPASAVKLGLARARVTWRISFNTSDSAALGWVQDSAFLDIRLPGAMAAVGLGPQFE